MKDDRSGIRIKGRKRFRGTNPGTVSPRVRLVNVKKRIPSPPSVSYTFTVRLRLENRVGKLAEVLSAIGRAGGDMGAVDIARVEPKIMVRDLTIHARDEEHEGKIVQVIRSLPGVSVVNVSDRVFLLHLGGKIQIQNKVSVNTRDILSMAYTPGVARVCKAIAEDPGESQSAYDQDEFCSRGN
jgi:malate dehydrogenase (oxaloacetate-decarboxylating)